MYAESKSFGVDGVGGYSVSVEVNVTQGLPSFDIVGLPDASVRESRERVRAAIKNSGFKFPVSRLTVNLAPADRKKNGTLYDLPITLAILAAEGSIRQPKQDMAFIGELSLTGKLKRVSGALPMALSAARTGIKDLFVPAENAEEATFADGINVYPVEDIGQLAEHLSGRISIEKAVCPPLSQFAGALPDFADVKGQENAKRALEIAAAGGHNILLIGSPGAGKSMMAKRLPGILPDMSREEIISSTEIYSVAGLTSKKEPVVSNRPFRSPHHTVSTAGLAGGGSVPRPGEISLAHNGVLFLDELPEFRSDVLEVLRQPLEDGEVTVSRISGSVTFPSRFMLAGAMNPCKCGWYGHPSGRCRCSEKDVRRYRSRISGPLLDRIDLLVEVPSLEYDELKERKPAESSAEIKKRVNAAREIQRRRYTHGGMCNAFIGSAEIREYCALDRSGETLMRRAYDTMNLTARSYDRILRVARTIADLAGEETISSVSLAEAIQYRRADFKDA